MKKTGLLSVFALSVATTAQSAAPPFHNSIPKEFHGTFSSTLAGCKEEYGVSLIEISSDRVHYYEGDDHLLIGISFFGSSTKSGKSVPLFNGRFTSRAESMLLGEVNARLEMESPNLLIRYALDDEGEPNPKPANTWVRCR